MEAGMATILLDNRTNSIEDEDKLHNDQIREKYMKLTAGDIYELLKKSAPVDDDCYGKYSRVKKNSIISSPVQQNNVAMPKQSIIDKKVEISSNSENLRSDIIKSNVDMADVTNVSTTSVYNVKEEEKYSDEEENEDHRPTAATLKHKNRSSNVAYDKSEKKSGNFLCLTKKDKFIFFAAIGLIVVLLGGIILASTLISNKTNKVEASQKRLNEVVKMYEDSNSAKNDYLDENNLSVVLNNFATNKGMTRK